MFYCFLTILVIAVTSSEARQLSILPVELAQDCKGPNEIKTNCGSACPDRCSKIGLPVGPCPYVCIYNICECKDGYFRDEITGNCVLPSRCTSVGIQTIEVLLKGNDGKADDNIVEK